MLAIGNKSTLRNDDVERLEEVVHDADKAQAIVDAAKASMGQDVSDMDLLNITHFAKCVYMCLLSSH